MKRCLIGSGCRKGSVLRSDRLFGMDGSQHRFSKLIRLVSFHKVFGEIKAFIIVGEAVCVGGTKSKAVSGYSVVNTTYINYRTTSLNRSTMASTWCAAVCGFVSSSVCCPLFELLRLLTEVVYELLRLTHRGGLWTAQINSQVVYELLRLTHRGGLWTAQVNSQRWSMNYSD